MFFFSSFFFLLVHRTFDTFLRPRQYRQRAEQHESGALDVNLVMQIVYRIVRVRRPEIVV